METQSSNMTWYLSSMKETIKKTVQSGQKTMKSFKIGANYTQTDLYIYINTVDGRNPAPPNMYETLWIMGYLSYQLVSRISEPSTVCIYGKIWSLRCSWKWLFTRGPSISLSIALQVKTNHKIPHDWKGPLKYLIASCSINIYIY